MNYTKGRNNKLKIGDKIQLTKEMTEWYVKNVNWSYLVPGDTEIQTKDCSSVAGFYHSFLTNSPIKGEVTGYGANDSGPKYKGGEDWINFKDKKVIRVTLKLKYSNYETYVSERHLRKI